MINNVKKYLLEQNIWWVYIIKFKQNPTYSFFFGNFKLLIQAKWYLLAFVSISELRKV